jgi:hypothetical protein
VQSSIAQFLLTMMVAFSSVYVVAWAMSTSDAIIREQERHTYDLFCLAPSGALGANLAICTAVLHRDDTLGWLGVLRKLLSAVLLIVLFSILLTTISRQIIPDGFEVLRLSLDMVALVIVSYVDHVQSVVLGSLVGMLTPIFSRTRYDATVLAGGLFLAFQAITLLVALVLLRGSLMITLLVFCLTREFFIALLWRVLAYCLNADSTALA